MSAAFAQDGVRGTRADSAAVLRLISASLDEALATIDTDVEAAKDDLAVARALLTSVLLTGTTSA